MLYRKTISAGSKLTQGKQEGQKMITDNGILWNYFDYKKPQKMKINERNILNQIFFIKYKEEEK